MARSNSSDLALVNLKANNMHYVNLLVALIFSHSCNYKSYFLMNCFTFY